MNPFQPSNFEAKELQKRGVSMLITVTRAENGWIVSTNPEVETKIYHELENAVTRVKNLMKRQKKEC